MLCFVSIPPADLGSLSLYYYAVCGRMCVSSVRLWVFLSVGDLLAGDRVWVQCTHYKSERTY